MSKSKFEKLNAGLKIGAAALFLTTAAVFLERLSAATEEPESIDDGNPYLAEGASGTGWDDADAIMQVPDSPTLYERFGKRALDKVLSFFGLIVCAPLFGLIAAAIEIDDPGPVLFKQKRVGRDKRFFEIHKFRSMKKSAPTDVPIEDFENQEEYMTRVGRLLRRTYLDELPQLWDVFRGRMSLVGPRPVIWNTAELIHERDKYGANGVRPGITGLAQLNGGIALDNIKKAEWDGRYVKSLREGNLEGFLTDLSCIADTAGVFSNDE
ncbi:MAG: sugar transferase [Firmicutes bacterium]|nr:sugar transferase [Bacillota bacterium]